MEILRELGAKLDYVDKYVSGFTMHEHSFDLYSGTAKAKTCDVYDCVVLITHHDAIAYGVIGNRAKLRVDTWGRYPKSSTNISKA